jgi:hypothetical protein
MIEVFIINRVYYNSDAGYEDNSLQGYVLSEESAKKLIVRLNELHKEAAALSEKITDHVFNVIQPSVPQEEYEDYPQYPKWRPGISAKEITEKMRAERDRIIQLQAEVQERNHKKSCARQEQIEKLKQEYIVSLNISPEVMKTMEAEDGGNTVLRYEYEKIEELK